MIYRKLGFLFLIMFFLTNGMMRKAIITGRPDAWANSIGETL